MNSELYRRTVNTVGGSFNGIKNWMNTVITSRTTSHPGPPRQCKTCTDAQFVIPRSAHRFGTSSEPDIQRHMVLGAKRGDRDFERTSSAQEIDLKDINKRSILHMDRFSTDQTDNSEGIDGSTRNSLRFVHQMSSDDELDSIQGEAFDMSLESSEDRINEFWRQSREALYMQKIRRLESVEPKPAIGESVDDINRKMSSVSSISVIHKKLTARDERNSICSKTSSCCIERLRVSVDECQRHHLLGKEVKKYPQIFERNKLDKTLQKARSRGEINGHVKMCAQYFGNCKVLRIIVLRATHLRSFRGKVWGKLETSYLNSKGKGQKRSLRRIDAQSQVVFNEQLFFEKIDEDKIGQLVLKLRLYNKERPLCKKKLLGEMIIPMYKYDFFFDTNIKGHMRQYKADLKYIDVFDFDADVEVTRDDRSIAAIVSALVKPASYPSPRVRK